MKAIKSVLNGLAVCGLAAFCCGCATTVQYDDPTSAQALSNDFGSSDLQQIAESMMNSLLAFQPIVELTAQRRPVVVVERVKNKTMQHIDTEAITDTIRAKLVNSGKFRFIDPTTDQQTVNQFNRQDFGGLVNRNTAVQHGQQYGAEYQLTANLTEITQSAGRADNTYYKFTMSLKSMKTGILEWTGEREIRKISKRPVLGM
jgi:uncharacterized protein (TIGR02722 family)